MVRPTGYADGEIAKIVTHVALSTLTNYFNLWPDRRRLSLDTLGTIKNQRR